MVMTRQRLTPKDHGRRISEEEFDLAKFKPGSRYEIIDGSVYVSPVPNVPENRLEFWLYGALFLYSQTHPEVTNYVTPKSRVFVDSQERTTAPEPDIAAYEDFPLGPISPETTWKTLKPILVCEILCDDAYKDLVRNVKLYFDVPSIREYWVIDGLKTPDRPTLIQHRRYGKRWMVREYPFGSEFTTKLLPGFRLVIDPFQR